MFTFLHGVPSLRWQFYFFLFYFPDLFMILIKRQAVTGESKELEEFRAEFKSDAHRFIVVFSSTFKCGGKCTWSSGLLFECPDLQSYFDLWVITHFNLHLLLSSRVLLTFHLSKHTLADLFIFCSRYKCCFNIFNTDFCVHCETC